AGAALTLAGAVVAVRWRPPAALTFLVACVVGSLGVAAALFYRGTLVDAVDPAAAVTLAVITGLAYRLSSERVAHRELMDLFGRYVSKDVAAELVQLSDRGALQLGGEVREVTVLFADIRGFTGLSVDMHPERLVALLNERFEIIIDAINRRDGIVNKFFGDAVMAFWNVPREQPDHAWLACQAALDALDRLDALPHTEPPVRFGVGINTGLALAGNVGSSGRREYTVIGDGVNTASRLSGAAGGGEVWVGRRTYDLVAERLATEELPPQQLKGIAAPVAAYRIVRGRPAPAHDGATAKAPV
ncbi:MAG TPA: adenylate/guanylate cyclase domain-containing protein, partial [Dehalococcoidia bacterium]|nr:adenylate/guanylate cyclase domain-containing protein [Dehalococcoidia bacterium]